MPPEDPIDQMRYPVRSVGEWAPYQKRSVVDRLEVEWRDFRYRRRVRGARRDVGLRRLSSDRPDLSAGELALLVCVKNGRFYVEFFLEHYRRLGVTRFIVLDDRSDDGTREAFLAQPDVDLFESMLDYTAAARGLLWRDALIARYGEGRWYLSVDIDEFLVFPDCERRDAAAFIEDLERNGLTRSLAPMLDLYPDGALGKSLRNGASRPTDISPLIDGDGYTVRNRKFCTSINGGPRQRLFDNEIRLTKFPVLFVDRSTRYLGGSVHGPLPFRRNFAPPTSVLLHFKFSANSLSEFAEIVERGSHFGGSKFYRLITENENFGADADLRYPNSITVGNSESLLSRGFFKDLRAGLQTNLQRSR